MLIVLIKFLGPSHDNIKNFFIFLSFFIYLFFLRERTILKDSTLSLRKYTNTVIKKHFWVANQRKRDLQGD